MGKLDFKMKLEEGRRKEFEVDFKMKSEKPYGGWIEILRFSFEF
jgi:hypothetical protein